MDSRTLVVSSVINILSLIVVLSFFEDGKVSPDLSNRLRDREATVLQLNEKIDRLNARLEQYESVDQSYAYAERDRLMSYGDVQEAIADMLASIDKSGVTQQGDGGERQGISPSQQEKYQSMSDKLDGYGGDLSFHELISEMDAQKLPDTYRNEILSKLVNKLNARELTPEEVIGANR